MKSVHPITGSQSRRTEDLDVAAAMIAKDVRSRPQERQHPSSSSHTSSGRRSPGSQRRPAQIRFVRCAERVHGRGMSDHIYKKLELVGSSPNGIEEAIRNAIARAGETVRNMRWFEVVETRGHIADGKVDHWQVTVKIGFTLDEK
jgi:flavin-binding protein dodecin